MASWSVFAQEQPSLQAAVRARFDAHRAPVARRRVE
jgi:hypothetical protein